MALTASLGHLGRPAHAWKALRNLRRSWLSREVVLFGGGLEGWQRRGGGPAQWTLMGDTVEVAPGAGDIAVPGPAVAVGAALALSAAAGVVEEDAVRVPGEQLRMVDGAEAARFLSTVKARLEEGDFGSEFGL